MQASDYVDALRVKLSAPSDYALAKMLGVQQNQIARYRKGGTFDNAMCVRASEILGLQPLEIIGDMELQRAHTDAQRAHWAKFLQQFQRVSAAVAACAIVGFTGLASPTAQAQNCSESLYYVKRRRPESAVHA